MPRYAVTPKNEELIAGFILSREVMDCTADTLRDYQSRLHQFRKFLLADYPGLSIVEANRQHVEAYLIGLKNKGRSSWTLRTQYRCLSAFYRWMIEEQFIGKSPLANIKPPRTARKGKEFLSDAQFVQLLGVCPLSTFTGARNAAIIWLLWTTGMRLSEMANLAINDLDNEGEKIKVFGKGRKERYVEYTKEAKRAVWRYMAYRDDKLPNLWLTEERRPIKPAGIRIALNRLYVRASFTVKDAAHIFRRTWAWQRIKEGVNLKYVMICGGWSTIDVLLQYVKAIEGDEAIDKIREARKTRR